MKEPKKVIDVSEFNGSINWSLVSKHVDAAIIRAGYRGYGAAGTLATDKKFKANIQGALAQKIPVGVYWCSQALSVAEAMAEADYLRRLLDGYDVRYPVYLDSEHMGPNASGRADKIGKARRTSYGLAFCRAMRDYGYTVGLYCSESWYKTEIDGAAFAKDGFETWIAKYSSLKPSMACDAWQYTDKGHVSGISGSVDISHFYWDYAISEDRDIVQHRFGLGDNTMDYLMDYKYAASLLEKIVYGSQPISSTDYRAQVQRRYGFDDQTMAYLDKWTWKSDLYKKLASIS